jgi:hypothetical protein
LANEVAKEYHSGKLDPLLAMKIEKKKRPVNKATAYIQQRGAV